MTELSAFSKRTVLDGESLVLMGVSNTSSLKLVLVSKLGDLIADMSSFCDCAKSVFTSSAFSFLRVDFKFSGGHRPVGGSASFSVYFFSYNNTTDSREVFRLAVFGLPYIHSCYPFLVPRRHLGLEIKVLKTLFQNREQSN